MTSSTIGFSLAEKLAIVQALDSLILADGKVHSGEIDVMSKLMNRIGFDSNIILQARNLPVSKGQMILKEMIADKKKFLAIILDEVANADGHFHEKEMALISNICRATEIN